MRDCNHLHRRVDLATHSLLFCDLEQSDRLDDQKQIEFVFLAFLKLLTQVQQGFDRNSTALYCLNPQIVTSQ